MNYNQALQYLYSFADYEKVPGYIRAAAHFDLRRMELLLQYSGNPHQKIPAVHIAGTKGKGSVASMIASILYASGYKTGLYTSPHLHSIRERIKLNGELISEDDLIRIVEKIEPFVAEINRENKYGKLTTFEILTAIAFVYFAKEKAEIQVIETGLGGRVDATNVINPLVCVITSISLDHMDVLGDNLADIAREKTGIIKSNCMVVSSSQKQEAQSVIDRACHKKGVPVIKVGRDIKWNADDYKNGFQQAQIVGKYGSYHVNIPLLGLHQVENAATAIAAVECLKDYEFKVTTDTIAQGISSVAWLGRFQILSDKPVIIVDGAHNADSVKKLREALALYFPGKKIKLIFGTSSDKDISGMVNEIGFISDDIVVTRSRHPRAMEPAKLAQFFHNHNIKPSIVYSVKNSIEFARSHVSNDIIICVTGSLFIVAEAIQAVTGCPYDEELD